VQKMRRIICTLICVAFSGFSLYAADSSNMDLVGSLNTGDRPRAVFVRGDYAYLADSDSGLRIVDISVSSSPVFKGHCAVSNDALGIYVSGDYAYIAGGDNGLSIFDISNPASPSKTSSFVGSEFYDVCVEGDYAYIADGASGLRVLNISNLFLPVEFGHYNTPGSARGVQVKGGYAYVADCTSGLRVVDISNPTLPVEVGYYDTAGESRGIAISGTYAYIADYTNGLRVIDISNPLAPSEVGHYTGSYQPQNIFVLENYAYLASYEKGVRVVNISTPSAMTESGYYDTDGYVYDVYALGNYVYAADDYMGLDIFNFLLSSPLYFIRGYVRTFSGEAVSGVTVTLFKDGIPADAKAVNLAGYYEFINLEPGNYTVRPSKENFEFSPAEISTQTLSGDIKTADFAARQYSRGELTLVGGAKGYVMPLKGEKLKIVLNSEITGAVDIKIYTLSGELVWGKTIAVSPGVNDDTWNCKNTGGGGVASGIYLVYANGAGFDVKKKAAIIR